MTKTNTASTQPEARQRHNLTLGEYVRRRNGVPLGASGALQNMLQRSLGAGTFAQFWQYWNPIWGYYLGRYIYAPTRRLLPDALALILTFAVSGALHDLAGTLVRRELVFVLTPWFVLMSLLVVLGQALNLNYTKQPFGVRVVINLVQIIGCLLIALWLT